MTNKTMCDGCGEPLAYRIESKTLCLCCVDPDERAKALKLDYATEYRMKEYAAMLKRVEETERERDAWKAKTREEVRQFMTEHPDLKMRELSDLNGVIEAERDLARTRLAMAREIIDACGCIAVAHGFPDCSEKQWSEYDSGACPICRAKAALNACTLHAPAPVTLQSQNDANEQSRTIPLHDEQMNARLREITNERIRELTKQNSGGSNPLAPTIPSVGQRVEKTRKGPDDGKA